MELGQEFEERRLKRKRKALTFPDKWEEKSKHLRYELSTKENTVKGLAAVVEDLQMEISALKEAKLREEMNYKNERDQLKLQYYRAKLDCSEANIRCFEALASQPAPVVIVKQTARKACDAESLKLLQEQMLELKAENLALKQHVQLLQKSYATQAEHTSMQVQEAIKENAVTCSKLLEKYKREIVKRKALHDTLVELRGNIRVYLRPKPLLASEEGDSVFAHDPYDDTVIAVPSKGRSFLLEKVFTSKASQAEVFGEVSALIQSVLDGHNVCIFAYGQTGSGKTHTMEGTCEDPGVNQRALGLLYEQTRGADNMSYQMEASMMEIYNETISYTVVMIFFYDHPNQISRAARENRVTASTSMNERSSRSHCILCVTVEETNLVTGTRTKGRLNLVDLAGSERVSKSQVEGARLKEAQNINRSLSCLGDVINALKNHHTHVPYRNSKLTYLLQESLGGDSKALMILQASSHPDNINETLSTLAFGQRVFSVELNSKNTPSSARRQQSETPTGQGTSGPRKMLALNDNGKTPTSSLVKATSVPSRLNAKLK
ncbi:kinesin-like protein [Plakobranchus ocellatus]|uniref:Kinesin-like protein n=1 Tax=Plakobranchus ocellatus TaxID=259542 RepID=A0AAV4DEG9_9GAST|nr:kinesin-like protein [Plakobranchus ocellatus]